MGETHLYANTATVTGWTFHACDTHLANELQEYLPARIFDAHVHVYRVSDLNIPATHHFCQGPQEASVAIWRECVGKQVGPSRLHGGLLMGVPFTAMDATDAVNAYTFEQVKTMPRGKALAVISPSSAPEQLRGYLEHPAFAGFKPYHLYSTQHPTYQSPIHSYLPEWAWEIADARGLAITLHMVKSLALADPENQRELRAYCEKYPNAKVILAHAARGFHAPNTIKGIASLRGLDNVWFDSSGICEPEALKAILFAFGPRKVLWGSDFPISEMRGKCVTLGDGFAWLDRDSVQWEMVTPYANPVLVGLENLRAVKQVADDFGLNDDDLQDIFADNALRLFGMKEESGTVTQELYRYAKTRIPGGTQLLSKRPEMFAPEQWPAYFREARGCEIWDMDGRHYYDMSLTGIGSSLLGFRDPDVTQAVIRRINLGSYSTLNPPEEVELADALCELHPWAEQARFGRCGGETCAMAVRIARSTTDRSMVAICGYHGWHDWYLASNLGDNDALRGHLLPGLDPIGVPRELRGTTVPFHYDSYEEFDAVMDQYGDKMAAVVMEPFRDHPSPDFARHVRECTARHGTLLIFDEVTIGWRYCLGGAHLALGVTPDMAVFSKAMGNGYPIAAVIGSQEAMVGVHASFISSLFWTESVGPTAALATIEKFRRIDVPAHVAHIGKMVEAYWQTLGEKHGLPVSAGGGVPCIAHFRFNHELADPLRTLYTQLMLERGFLASLGFYPSLAHTEEVVHLFGKAVDEVFGEIADALADGTVMERLKGPVAHTGFRRLL